MEWMCYVVLNFFVLKVPPIACVDLGIIEGLDHDVAVIYHTEVVADTGTGVAGSEEEDLSIHVQGVGGGDADRLAGKRNGRDVAEEFGTEAVE